MLMVADGVSRAPKDWLASQSAIGFVKAYLLSNKHSTDRLLEEAVLYANDKVMAGVDDTVGMLTTLSVLICQPSSKKVFWANVGDSRIYGWNGDEWKQLTVDDSTSQPYMENGKMRLRDGAPIMVSALTKAIGSSPALKVEVHEIKVNDYSGLLLCSDGLYSLPGFSSIASKIYESVDMEREAGILKNAILSDATDDASLALIRFNGMADLDIRSLIVEESEGHKTIPSFMLADALEKELEQAISQSDDSYIGQILDLMERRSIFFKRERMIELLEGMIAIRSRHLATIKGIIRRL